jgi:molybdopterin/thiamine biosynthesis adenylyltransferase
MMSRNEHLLSRLMLQQGWDMSSLCHVGLVLCGIGIGAIKTLAMAAVSSGFTNIFLMVEKRNDLYKIADDIRGHLSPTSPVGIRVDTPRTFRLGKKRKINSFVYIVDAGDESNDGVYPEQDDLSYYYAECSGSDQYDFFSLGTDREAVSSKRKGIPVSDRAELSALCSQLITGALADLRVFRGLEPQSPVSRIELPKLPEVPVRPEQLSGSILYPGGGGAIAQQEMWASSLDPVLRTVNRQRNFFIIDPKYIHESCRARQWAYPPESIHEAKSEWTAKWLRHLFPGARVVGIKEKISEAHFLNGLVSEAVASIDNWQGRKKLAGLCDKYNIPWWSTGSSFFEGFARQVNVRNQFCAPATEGVERLKDRSDDDEQGPETSCSSDDMPLPSSVIPQLVLGSWIATQKRNIILGQADPKTLARGIAVHISHESRFPGYKGLRWSPGRLLNLKLQSNQRRTNENTGWNQGRVVS